MENWIYLGIRLVAAVYVLYKVWVMLFSLRLFGLWDRIFVHNHRRPKERQPSMADKQSVSSLVGKARGGYLAPRAPVLEPVALTSIETKPDYDGDEEFEIGPDTSRPSDEELYGAEGIYPSLTDISTGRTFEQLAEAVEFMSTPVEDDEMAMRTAETLSLMRGSELFEFVEREVSSTEDIGQLLDDCLDGNGARLPRRKSKGSGKTAAFDVETYV